MGNLFSCAAADAEVLKYDPWSKVLLTKDQFFLHWSRSYNRAELEECWLSLGGVKKWDPWSNSYLNKDVFMAVFQKVAYVFCFLCQISDA